MMSNDKADLLTVLVITWNEAPNLGRTLRSISWADRILVIDSFSSDETVQIAQQFEQVKVIQRDFVNFADQCNFGLSQVETDWVLSIDADYVFPPVAEREIRKAMTAGPDAFMAGFQYWVHGRSVYGSILPGRVVLYRKAKARYEQDGHGHRVQIDGQVGMMPFRVAHDDRKPLSRWLNSQVGYAQDEAEKLTTTPASKLGRNDRVRRWIVPAPFLVFVMVFFIRGGFISGWRGFYYALQRFIAECLISLCLLDIKLLKRRRY